LAGRWHGLVGCMRERSLGEKQSESWRGTERESKEGMERGREREREQETERETETQAGETKRESEHGTERERARERCRCPFHKAVSAERSIDSHGTNDQLHKFAPSMRRLEEELECR